MTANMDDDRFLGVRWRAVWVALARPWRRASGWFWVQALTPSLPVSLIEEDGRKTQWIVSSGGVMTGPHAQGQTDHTAIELPQALVLHRRIALPLLDDAELQRAIHLDASVHNPFPADDLCMSHSVSHDTQGALQIDMVLASRRQVLEYLATRTVGLQSAKNQPEVWVASRWGSASVRHLVIQGFGEQVRMARHRRGRAINIAAVGLMMLLLGALAITPSLQLRSRALESYKAYEDLYERARPALATREALVRSAERVQQIEGLLRNTLDPAETLNLLTRVLTDDTSLTVLQIKGRKVRLEGQTTNAAELMQLLGKQPGFEDVVAPAPAIRPAGSSKDNFKIEFTLDTSRMALPEKVTP